MSLVTPHTWTAGDDATSGNLQTVTDAVAQLQGGAPSAGALDFFTAVQVNAQTGLTSGAATAITFDTTSEVIDAANGHSTVSNTSRYVAKVPGYYEIGGVVAFAASTSGTRRFVQVNVNNTALPGSQTSVPIHGSVMAVPLPPGVYQYLNGTTDYVELIGVADYASWATVVTGAAASRLTVRWIHS